MADWPEEEEDAPNQAPGWTTELRHNLFEQKWLEPKWLEPKWLRDGWRSPVLRPDHRDRKCGRFRLRRCFTVGPPLFLGRVFGGAVPVACLWLSLWV